MTVLPLTVGDFTEWGNTVNITKSGNNVYCDQTIGDKG